VSGLDDFLKAIASIPTTAGEKDMSKQFGFMSKEEQKENIKKAFDDFAELLGYLDMVLKAHGVPRRLRRYAMELHIESILGDN
jgi:hypothetical protein